ncbi:hypothetical protein TNCV_5135701 [Trichonephila clavipes]|nr:hypothetical protein TNCV_5135701 [Trichonephila clavipes]
MSTTKVMLIKFWDANGVLHTEFLTKELTVNSDICVLYNITSLKQRVLRARHEGNVFLLHHDNARPHCNAQTLDVIKKIKFTVVVQPSYSPDLAPSATQMCQIWSPILDIILTKEKLVFLFRETRIVSLLSFC